MPSMRWSRARWGSLRGRSYGRSLASMHSYGSCRVFRWDRRLGRTGTEYPIWPMITDHYSSRRVTAVQVHRRATSRSCEDESTESDSRACVASRNAMSSRRMAVGATLLPRLVLLACPIVSCPRMGHLGLQWAHHARSSIEYSLSRDLTNGLDPQLDTELQSHETTPTDIGMPQDIVRESSR
ncbi:hypothetical protein C8Q76DRAFT_140434 [Earliella scabrosa]|nr:hypothetical protein C8Q76DRAFT_140434 [Earliella scabrosa]